MKPGVTGAVGRTYGISILVLLPEVLGSNPGAAMHPDLFCKNLFDRGFRSPVAHHCGTG
jgi:hypothetical protein